MHVDAMNRAETNRAKTADGKAATRTPNQGNGATETPKAQDDTATTAGRRLGTIRIPTSNRLTSEEAAPPETGDRGAT